ncbi:hypothetical protein [Rhodobacter viridis]|uniref:hypothetical protein n=1 Tax=Rhodobacter viridis TaxID=1054202 RepID=UPI000DA25ED2|nr:hypothetical protein [Rhodobacter viridis]
MAASGHESLFPKGCNRILTNPGANFLNRSAVIVAPPCAYPAAVARLQHVIAVAQSRADAAAQDFKASISPRPTITLADFGHAVWQRYSAALEADDAARASYPRADEIEAEREKLTRKAAAGEIGNEPSDILDASLDFLLL